MFWGFRYGDMKVCMSQMPVVQVVDSLVGDAEQSEVDKVARDPH